MRLPGLAKEFLSAAWPVFALGAVLLLGSFFLLRRTPPDWKIWVFWTAVTIIALFIFLTGMRGGLTPMAETVGIALPGLGSRWLIILFALAAGYLATLIEPALKLLADSVEAESAGALRKGALIHSVAAGFSLGMALGAAKILWGIPFKPVIVTVLLILLVMTVAAPKSICAVAWDCASAATGPVNIPVNLALALGLSRVVEGGDPLFQGFGLIALSALGATMGVLAMGTVTLR